MKSPPLRLAVLPVRLRSFRSVCQAACLGLVLLGGAACEPPFTPPPSAPVASVQVTSPASTIGVAQRVQLAATSYDAGGAVVSGRMVAWSSANPAIATVDAKGMAQGIAPGTVEIRATVDGKTGAFQLQVASSRLAPLGTNLTAIMGALYPQPLQVRLTTPDGTPVAGATVMWRVSGEGGGASAGTNGWVFPFASVTDASGVAATRWVAGDGADQLVIAFSGADTARIRAQAAGTAHAANSVHLDYFTPSLARAEAFRIEIEPQSAPNATYYEAIGFDGGYTGLQTSGDLGGKQVIFSVWDVNGVGAQLVDASGSMCASFGGEGTGIKCRFLYDWQAGRRYRFEVQAVPGAATTDLTAWFTDVTAGTSRKVATLRLAKVSAMNHNDVFVEDFGPAAPTCLQAAFRAVKIREPEYSVGGVWQKFSTATFNTYYPRTVCANVSAAANPLVTLLTTGDIIVGDPTASNQLPVP
jgi:Domain of unknown function (DUF3472)/Bacterial Ig-like domain (group 2)